MQLFLYLTFQVKILNPKSYPNKNKVSGILRKQLYWNSMQRVYMGLHQVLWESIHILQISVICMDLCVWMSGFLIFVLFIRILLLLLVFLLHHRCFSFYYLIFYFVIFCSYVLDHIREGKGSGSRWERRWRRTEKRGGRGTTIKIYCLRK